MLLWWTALLCLLLNFIESSEIVGSDDETIFDIVPNLDDIDYLESINQTKCPLHLINFYGAKKISMDCEDQFLNDEENVSKIIEKQIEDFGLEDLNLSIILHLERNKLKEIPLMTINSSIIEEMDLSYNMLNLNGSTYFHHSILRLNLSHNQISSISGNVFQDGSMDVNRSNLTHLDLSHNSLSSLPNDLFYFTVKLEALSLAHNPLVELDLSTSQALATLTGLRYLNLAYCGLRILPQEVMNQLKHLLTLDLKGNHFISVDPNIKLAKELTSLIIDDNLFTNLNQSSFEGMNKLQYLDVSQNLHLSWIGRHTFVPLLNLLHLEMKNNPSLDWIHPEAWPLDDNDTLFDLRLTRLDISGNKLSHLPSMMLTSFSDWFKLSDINLQNNPWECDCHNEWIFKKLVPWIHNVSLDLLKNATCSGPKDSNIFGEPLYVISQMSMDSLPCPINTFYDPYQRYDPPQNDLEIPKTKNGLLTAIITVVCLISIASTAYLVFSLYRQQRHARGHHKGYRLAGKMIGSAKNRISTVLESENFGHVNNQFKDDETEMKIVSFS